MLYAPRFCGVLQKLYSILDFLCIKVGRISVAKGSLEPVFEGVARWRRVLYRLQAIAIQLTIGLYYLFRGSCHAIKMCCAIVHELASRTFDLAKLQVSPSACVHPAEPGAAELLRTTRFNGQIQIHQIQLAGPCYSVMSSSNRYHKINCRHCQFEVC